MAPKIRCPHSKVVFFFSSKPRPLESPLPAKAAAARMEAELQKYLEDATTGGAELKETVCWFCGFLWLFLQTCISIFVFVVVLTKMMHTYVHECNYASG